MGNKSIGESAVDTAMISLGSKSMGGGTVTSVIGFLSSNGFAVLIGVTVTILGFICSIYFQRRRDARDKARWEQEKIQMQHEEERRIELHRLKIQQLTREYSE